jgi:hypothetical protein
MPVDGGVADSASATAVMSMSDSRRLQRDKQGLQPRVHREPRGIQSGRVGSD